jgi:hypothetical protein
VGVLRVVIASGFLLLLVPTFHVANLLESRPPTPAEVRPGEREMKALATAWPGRVAETAVREGEWMLRIDGRWFAWAHGRLLAESDRDRWQEYAPYSFSGYPLLLPPLQPLDAETAAQLRRSVREDRINPPRRNEEFLGTLLGARDRASTESMLVTMEVAGFTVSVHESLAGPLAVVSGELQGLRRSDPTVAAFLKGLIEINGYNYRYVEGTRSRSLHSYGCALDLIPRSYHGKSAYWLWSTGRTPDWWTIPYDRRWMLPQPVIDAFERNGFIWGGKWVFFDTMHFEYRPEVLMLAREKPSVLLMASALRS